ncbi:MAG: hypothetical protein GY866_31135 [Proteobacteria bacterium]|nr:hypothetical protein [Pseudomonadota bacterium]
MIEKLKALSVGLTRWFPNGNNPYQIMTCLLEECGELAQQINHFEGSGIKKEKYGEPNREHLAKEIKGVLSCVFRLIDYYGIEQELDISLDESIQNLRKNGYLDQ